jgi:hypothetical protein
MDCDLKDHRLYPTYITLPTEIDLVLSPADWHQRGWFLAVQVVTVQRIEGYRALLRVFDQDKTEFDLIIQFQGNEAWTFPLDKVRETDALLIRDPVLSQLPNGELGVTVVGTKTIKVCCSPTRFRVFSFQFTLFYDLASRMEMELCRRNSLIPPADHPLHASVSQEYQPPSRHSAYSKERLPCLLHV